MKLVLATGNPHKLREFAVLLHPHELLSVPAEVLLPPETGTTFAANALVKARTAAAATGLPGVADDSGVEAAALGGRPGVCSARYDGPHAADEQNLARLVREVPAGSVLAYVCALAHVSADGSERVFEGRCTGRMADTPRGDDGFGYDPIFLPDDGPPGLTMAELRPAQKDSISHRGRAARGLLRWLAEGDGAAPTQPHDHP